MSQSIVVVPTFNEAQNLPALVERIAAAGDYHILVVDDASPDGTGELADRLALRYEGRLFVVHRTAKEGLGRAYVAGFRRALAGPYEFIFQMDADLSHDPAALAHMRAALETADVAIGSRYVPGGGSRNWPLRRRLLSSWGSLYSRLLLGLSVRDITGGFKGFRRRALEALNLDGIGARGFGFQVEVNYRLSRLGFSLVEVPITFADRTVGTSKMAWPIVAEALALPWQLRLSGLADAVGGAGWSSEQARALRGMVTSLRLVSSDRPRNDPFA